MTEHRTELRAREWKQSICVEPGCDYAGQPAVPGHCSDPVDPALEALIARLEAETEAELARYQRAYQGAEYIKMLESLFVCATLNWHFCLDEVVMLRRDNAALKRRLVPGESLTYSTGDFRLQIGEPE